MHYPLNITCDFTHFVVVVPVPGATSVLIKKYFMQDVLLKFGICALMVINDGKPFKGLFTVTCTALKLSLDCTAKRNHKSLSVERYHRFPKKVVTIATSDRDTLNCFVEVGVSAGYAWNIAHIDGIHTSLGIVLLLVGSDNFLWKSV